MSTKTSTTPSSRVVFTPIAMSKTSAPSSQVRCTPRLVAWAFVAFAAISAIGVAGRIVHRRVYPDPSDIRFGMDEQGAEAVNGMFDRYVAEVGVEADLRANATSRYECEVTRAQLDLLKQELALSNLRAREAELRVYILERNATIAEETRRVQQQEGESEVEAAAENAFDLHAAMCRSIKYPEVDCLSPRGILYRETSNYAPLEGHSGYLLYEDLSPRVFKLLWTDPDVAIEANRILEQYVMAANGGSIFVVMTEVENIWRVSL